MAKRGGMRPKKTMMEAVNLALGGKDDQARKHLQEFPESGDWNLLLKYKKIRTEKNLGPYTFERAPRGSKKKAGKAAASGDILDMVTKRLGPAKVVQLKQKVDKLCVEMKGEIDSLAQKMEEVKRLEKQAADAQRKLEEAQTKLGL